MRLDASRPSELRQVEQVRIAAQEQGARAPAGPSSAAPVPAEAARPAGKVATSPSIRARAREAGLPTAAIPIRFDGAPWTVFKLWRHFRRRGTRALLANLTKDLKAAAVAGRLAGVPVVLGTRESDFPLKNKAYYRWYFGKLATGLLVNSEATRATVLASARPPTPNQATSP